MFYRRGLIETWGRGTLKIASLMQEAGLPAPVLKDNAGFVILTFVLPAGAAPRIQGSDLEKTSGKTSGKILDAVRQNPQVTIPELSAQIGVTTRSIERSQCLFFPRGYRIDIFDCGYPIMDLTDLHKARGKRVRGKRTVYDIAGHLFGADGSRALPRDASARIKRLIRARATAKASR